MRNVTIVMLGVFVSFGAAGCSIGKVKPPKVRVTNVRLAEQSDEGSVVLATLELENPNKVPLPLPRNKYKVTVAGKTFEFNDKPQRTLPASGVQTIEMPASFTTAGRDLAGASYEVSGAVRYNPPGQFRRLLTESGIPLPDVSYSQRGRLEQ